MARYIRASDNTVVGINEVRAANPNTSLVDGLDYGDLGFPLLALSAAPAALPWHRVVEAPPVGNVQQWAQVPMTPTEIERILIASLDAHFDATANQRRYRDRYTCAVRAGYTGPFQAEGQAFASWMDTCNALGYQIMAEVQAGTRAIPTPEELIGAMPAMVWPS